MKIAIITGASSGMGMECARQLDKRLHHTDELWLIARRKAPMEELAVSLRHKTRILAMDITDAVQMKQLSEVLGLVSPLITVLVNCAGVGSHGNFEEQEQTDITAMMQLNIGALTQMTKLCLPYMRKGSRILQFASGAAFLPQASFAVYAASKAYVYSFSRALAKELRERGITVTAVCPGPVNTPFLQHAYGELSRLNGLKKMTMAQTECVVAKAMEDCKKKKEVSLCGLPMWVLYAATQTTQNLLQKFT